MSGFVLHSQDAGIYLGSFLGLGFWSKWDPVGQDMAVLFPNSEAIASYIASVDDASTLPIFEPVWVDSVEKDYATIAECQAAGLPPWSPNE